MIKLKDDTKKLMTELGPEISRDHPIGTVLEIYGNKTKILNHLNANRGSFISQQTWLPCDGQQLDINSPLNESLGAPTLNPDQGIILTKDYYEESLFESLRNKNPYPFLKYLITKQGGNIPDESETGSYSYVIELDNDLLDIVKKPFSNYIERNNDDAIFPLYYQGKEAIRDSGYFNPYAPYSNKNEKLGPVGGGLEEGETSTGDYHGGTIFGGDAGFGSHIYYKMFFENILSLTVDEGTLEIVPNNTDFYNDIGTFKGYGNSGGIPIPSHYTYTQPQIPGPDYIPVSTDDFNFDFDTSWFRLTFINDRSGIEEKAIINKYPKMGKIRQTKTFYRGNRREFNVYSFGIFLYGSRCFMIGVNYDLFLETKQETSSSVPGIFLGLNNLNNDLTSNLNSLKSSFSSRNKLFYFSHYKTMHNNATQGSVLDSLVNWYPGKTPESYDWSRKKILIYLKEGYDYTTSQYLDQIDISSSNLDMYTDTGFYGGKYLNTYTQKPEIKSFYFCNKVDTSKADIFPIFKKPGFENANISIQGAKNINKPNCYIREK